jgi:hypothetical protein
VHVGYQQSVNGNPITDHRLPFNWLRNKYRRVPW